MFNKKLIAGSVFALLSAPALAIPTFSYTAQTVSTQGAAQLAALTLPAVTVTSGAEYSDDDLIVIDYNVALATGYTPASNLTMYANCTGGGVLGASNHGGVLTWGLLSSDTAAGSVTYRITDVNYTGDFTGSCSASLNSSVGAVLSLGTPKVDGAAALAAGSVTGTYKATLPNGITDIDGGSITIGFSNGATPPVLTTAMSTYANQFADTVGDTDLLSGIIDVADATAARSHFYIDGTNISTSDAQITMTDASSSVSPAAITGLTFSIMGDFSFLADEDAATAGIQNDSFSINIDKDGGADDSANIEATTVTADKITWVVTGITELDAKIQLDFDNNDNGLTTAKGKIAMVEGPFTYDVAIAYTDGGTDGAGAGAVAGSVAVTSGGDAGKWTLNGSTTVIKNYPLSSAVTQFVWVTNTGTQTGNVFATAIGGTGAQVMTSCDLGVTSKPGEIQRITNELNTCLTAAGLVAGRAEVTVTVNAIAGDISVYAGYKHVADADRLNLTQ